jgi:hypothetical protein
MCRKGLRVTGAPAGLLPFEQFPLRLAGDRTAACAHAPPACRWSGACRCRHLPRVPSRGGVPVERMRDGEPASCPFQHIDSRRTGDRSADCAGARGACRCLSVAKSRHCTERSIPDRPHRHTGAGSAGGPCVACAVRPGRLRRCRQRRSRGDGAATPVRRTRRHEPSPPQAWRTALSCRATDLRQDVPQRCGTLVIVRRPSGEANRHARRSCSSRAW